MKKNKKSISPKGKVSSQVTYPSEEFWGPSLSLAEQRFAYSTGVVKGSLSFMLSQRNIVPERRKILQKIEKDLMEVVKVFEWGK